MRLEVFHLEALTPFRIGSRGGELTGTDITVHSDTLFSALCIQFLLLYGKQELERLLSLFDRNPPFLLSSAFPYVTVSSQTIRLFPRPMNTPPGVKNFALMKSVELVSQPIFERWVNNQPILASGHEASEDSIFNEGRVWVTSAEANIVRSGILPDTSGRFHLWAANDVPRVTVDRITSKTNVFHATRLSFRPGSGLWVGIHWLDNSWRTAVSDTLMILGDRGIGGERGIGHGQYRISQRHNLDLPDIGNGPFTTLSLYWPQQEEITGTLTSPNSAYDFTLRGGWSNNISAQAVRRKSVRMLVEGSILESTGRQILGGLANVKPDQGQMHPVYRYGYALPVGIGGSTQ